jgi:DNA-binding protein H-NS
MGQSGAKLTSKLTSMSIEELWQLHENVSEALATKLLDEKTKLERRLVSLRPPSPARTRRPYPRVLPKFANPDEPNQLWSGRGKKPRWVAEKLASGAALQELRINPRRLASLQ